MEKTYDAGLDASREFLVDIPPVPLWSETGAYSAFDPARGIGFWMHLGRFSYDPTLWHEALIVYLPGGERLAFKNYGRGDLSRGPAGALMSLSCVEPFQRWEFRYDGPARRVTNDVLYAGGLAQGAEERLVVELTMDSVKPIWDLASQCHEEASWAHTHDQQLSVARGRIVSDDGESAFEGCGWRDHSRGPRDMTGVVGHTLLGAWFPDDDRGFVATHVESEDGAFSGGRVFLGDADEPITPVMPSWEDPARLPDRFDVVLPALSADHAVGVEVLQVAPITMEPPNHLSIGLVPTSGALAFGEGQARFTWDGRVGYGYVERSRRLA